MTHDPRVVIVVVKHCPFSIQVENVGSELTVAGSNKPTGLLEGGKQKMYAGVNGDEEGLGGETHRAAAGTSTMTPRGMFSPKGTPAAWRGATR